MSEDVDQLKMLAGLKQEQYYFVTIELWDEQKKNEIHAILQANGYHLFQIYRTGDIDNRFLIVLEGADLPKNLLKGMQHVYSRKRNTFQKVLPLVIIFISIALTAFWASKYGSLMAGSIVIGMPLILGALTEYFSILSEPRPLLYKMFKTISIVFVAVLVFGFIVLQEGIICIVLLSPLLLVGLILGAVIMRGLCFFLWKPTAKIYSLALLPLLLFLILPDFSRDYFGQTQREMIIHAPQAEVFRAINEIGQIKETEVPDSFIFTMGFPKPIFGMTEQRAEGMVRTIQWERGVQFEEKVLANHAPYLLSWDYQFNHNSFPKGSLDDHVEVGGRYFDLLKTDYQLAKIDEKTTKLILTIDYRVSTEFNWYSQLWINYILNEFSDVVMTIHKNRLEK